MNNFNFTHADGTHVVINEQGYRSEYKPYQTAWAPQTPNTGVFIMGESQSDRISRHVHFGLNEEELAPYHEMDRHRERMWKIKLDQDAAKEASSRPAPSPPSQANSSQPAKPIKTVWKVQDLQESPGGQIRVPSEDMSEKKSHLFYCREQASVCGYSSEAEGHVDVLDGETFSACMLEKMPNGMPKIQINAPAPSNSSDNAEHPSVAACAMDKETLRSTAVGSGAVTGGLFAKKICPKSPWWASLACHAGSSVAGAYYAKEAAKSAAQNTPQCMEAQQHSSGVESKKK